MSTSHDRHTENWWSGIGLNVADIRPGSWHAKTIRDEVAKVLGEVEPVGFRSKESSALLSAADLAARLDAVANEVEARIEQSEHDKSELRRMEVSERVEAELSAQDADEPITEGRWAGFTRGEARAWCWNLFQYEPQGFVLPKSFIRARALAELEAGELPEVFDYPERAREHADRGLTPRTYRDHKQALGATTFSPDLVRVKMGRGFPIE